ncbi:adenosylcobinamide-GDP ribazoletransferase [Massilia psychrophila]|uniref:Adenosylcobinamide-GDP ribazoletransferase n=1 Tax=Massilia psychrophila TaxID=1603353 RepID=A0A2G8SWZ6_9BURK|nr:adenosylcobinamide-GDP ribazoletransferase [Massilia psychrophila]PIL38223.1 adenosylcobinamide-GDP ribazoletransferase [Massilia psychrophila]GGE90808.1 adenosylcobinamide-GDP ribazoletransferase [Massilia psychrophila]
MFLSACAHQARLFFVALQFFTRLPVPRWVGFEPHWLHHASRYFSLVGIVVAAISAAVYAIAACVVPAAVAAVLATCAGVYATGAFHEDGFADVCDGFGGALTPQRVLEIMKDSRVGAYGAIGIALLLGLKCLLLAQFSPVTAIAALFLAHPLSRLAACMLIWRLHYVRTVDAKAKPLAQHMTGAELAIGAACALLPVLLIGVCGYLAWTSMLAGALLGGLAAAWLAWKFVRRIGGYTGDCLGAVQQASEVAIYLGVLAASGQPGWR